MAQLWNFKKKPDDIPGESGEKSCFDYFKTRPHRHLVRELIQNSMDVPAEKANLHYFSDILTHFSVEESAESGRGKLMDELVRLRPIMDDSRDVLFCAMTKTDKEYADIE